MPELVIGAVDVYPLRRVAERWEVLLVRRAEGVRCAGAWEIVSGRIEAGERPPEAAVRELREETGLEVERLYNVTVQPFYLHVTDTVMLSVAFAAFVRDGRLSLGEEHAEGEWLATELAIDRMSWPRSRAVLRDILALLGGGDAGPMEDVLRVR
ncbi:MAG TPA: NUDIX domain-containing protein [Gemmatimonadaceae bacterium]|nr:NUDIX domain-containing protein [Gemmatimonadaceae bacterium]